MIWPILAILTLCVILLITAPLLKGGRYSKGLVSLFFAAFMGLSLGTYASIGRPDLLKTGALQAYQAPPGPTAEQVQAAQELSVEDRAEMILAMVEGLADRLEENPQDPEGWARLIRARTVLGQKEKLQADIDRVKLLFKDSPETIDTILKAND
ncbi:hypothetical protein N9W89_05935 [Hellea sp.]|nr:hypothetical protein [Hellea sp.]